MKRNLLALLACVLMALCIISCDNHTHTYSDEWSSDETYHWHAATCEHSSEVKDKAEHVWNDGEITTPATEKDGGVKTYTCEVCKKTKTEKIDHEHTLVENEAQAATCTKAGWNAYVTCSVCGYTTYKEIPAKGHDYKCVPTEDNTKHHEKCSICGDVKADSEKDHVWDDGTVTKAATCTEKGVKTFTCSDCKATKTEEITALGHDMSSWSDIEDDATKRTRKCKRENCSHSETVAVISGEGTTEKPYEIATPNGLIALASRVNGTVAEGTEAETFSGKIINLIQDIDLKNEQWTPIGLYKNTDGNDNEKPFSGTFDGKDHVITGLRIDCDEGKSSYRALFGYVKDGVVKNFTIEGEVKACDASGVVAALRDGTVENVKSYVDVSVSKKTSADNAKVAGIVVAAKDGEKGCIIKDCTNYGKIASTAEGANDAIGGIIADIKLTKMTIENCTNEGDVSSTSTEQWAGGIIGIVEKSENTLVKKCTNTGKITSGRTENGVGEIVGVIQTGERRGTIEDCTYDTAKKDIGFGYFDKPLTTSD